MKKIDFENYLGKRVAIKLCDEKIVKGCLRKTQDEMFKNEPNLYIPKNYYFMTDSENSLISNSCIFRVSHVKKVVEI